MKTSVFLSTLSVILAGTAVWATPPVGYYDDTANLTGETLRTVLRSKVSNHTVCTYAQAYDLLEYIEEDPDNTSNILTHYTRESIPKTMRSVSATGYWNREHMWPQSLGSASGTPMYTDLHHLWGEEMSINSTRNNRVFNYVTNPIGTKLGCKWNNNNEFEVRDDTKGDVARALFYMELVYGTATYNYTLLDTNSPTVGQMGVKSALTAWHKDDPIDDRDARRNDRVYEKQGNRNPFSDKPEYVGRLYNLGIAPTTSTISVSFTDMTTQTLTSGNPGNPLATLTAELTSGTQWQFGAITVKASGTMAPSNIDNLKLYIDINRDGAVGANDILLTQTTFTGDTATLNAPGAVLTTTDSSLQLLVTGDLSASAPTSATFALSVPANNINSDPATPPHLAPTYSDWQTKTVEVVQPVAPPTPSPDDNSTSVVINKFYNDAAASNEMIELLVTRNGLSLAGVWVKDFSSSGANDGGGGFQFKDVAKWHNLKAGTLIVLTNGAAPPAEKQNVLTAGMRDTGLFTSGGGTFDISKNEIIMLKTGTKAGTADCIHAIGTCTTSATQWLLITTGSKQRTSLPSDSGTTIYVQNSTSTVADFNTDSELKSATSGGPTFGEANSEENRTFIGGMLPVQLSSYSLE